MDDDVLFVIFPSFYVMPFVVKETKTTSRFDANFRDGVDIPHDTSNVSSSIQGVGKIFTSVGSLHVSRVLDV